MTLARYLASRGLTQQVIEDLLPHIPDKEQEDVFLDAESIMNPDQWFYWPEQQRFVMVGECPNGDGVAIDSETEAGAVCYVAHDYLGSGRASEEMVIRVALSPSDFVQRFLDDDDFPYDYWEAKSRSAEEPRV